VTTSQIVSLPFLTPMNLLLAAIGITAIAAMVYWLIRRREQQALSELAKSWRMHYSPRDVFNLAPRVAPRLPVPGAAEVRVRDLIYGTEEAGHRYIFSADYTVGVIRSKSRRRFVVSVLEPRGRSDASVWSSMRVAPDDLSLIQQYESLKKEG